MGGPVQRAVEGGYACPLPINRSQPTQQAGTEWRYPSRVLWLSWRGIEESGSGGARRDRVSAVDGEVQAEVTVRGWRASDRARGRAGQGGQRRDRPRRPPHPPCRADHACAKPLSHAAPCSDHRAPLWASGVYQSSGMCCPPRSRLVQDLPAKGPRPADSVRVQGYGWRSPRTSCADLYSRAT